MRPRSLSMKAAIVCGVLLGSALPAAAGVHLWRVKEIFSNADGTVQFIEIATCCGSTGENFLAGHVVRSTATGRSFTFPANVVGSTLNKHVLLATSAFDALPGGPAPDHIIADGFIATTGDTITFSVYDTLIFPAGRLPIDGTGSLNKDPNDAGDTTFVAVNSPTNFAGATGSVNAVSGPPGVPDGTGGTTPMTAAPGDAGASVLRLSFDASTCTNDADYHILYGERSGLPASPGGAFSLLGSVCGIGTAGQYDWTGVPSAADGPGLIWFLVVTTDDRATEGSWGRDGAGNERLGPGNGGASGTCALVKSVANSCGHVSP
ncbi:MAG: hypothetical protein ACRD6R_13975 [Candidatus Polarisedimenticolia bacterium]